MCGIVGLLTASKYGFLNDDIQRFNQLLVCDSVRGPDSTGVFGVNTFGNVSYLKEKGNPFKLMETPEYQAFMKEATNNIQFVIGHNRKATVGTITDETAHPFVENNIILVHNGTLRNHTKLTSEAVEVDSHAITHAFAERGYKQALTEIEGAFTLVWYDTNDKTLRVVRNDQRPLTFLKYNNKLMLSSEGNLAKWIATRDNFTVPTTEFIEVKPGIVYSIKVSNGLEIEEEEVDFYKPPPVVTYPRLVDTTKKHRPNQNKAPSKDSEKFSGWDGYECKVGDKIVLNIEEVEEFKNTRNSDDPNRIAGYLIGRRIFPNQPPVFAHLTKALLDDLYETDELCIAGTVTRLVIKNNNVSRIYVDHIVPYVPVHDVSGAEVFNEEWKLVNSHKCKTCGKEMYWKDIQFSRFKFRSPDKSRLICKECIQ